MNEINPLLISAIGALATSVAFLFKTMMDIVKRSENRSQQEIERSKEEISRVINMCEQRLESEKESRNIVMAHMESFGVTLEKIGNAITTGFSDVNKSITEIRADVDELSKKVDDKRKC